jgi:hypothetical protein
MEYLRSQGIPFIALHEAVAGCATTRSSIRRPTGQSHWSESAPGDQERKAQYKSSRIEAMSFSFRFANAFTRLKASSRVTLSLLGRSILTCFVKGFIGTSEAIMFERCFTSKRSSR